MFETLCVKVLLDSKDLPDLQDVRDLTVILVQLVGPVLKDKLGTQGKQEHMDLLEL